MKLGIRVSMAAFAFLQTADRSVNAAAVITKAHIAKKVSN